MNEHAGSAARAYGRWDECEWKRSCPYWPPWSSEIMEERRSQIHGRAVALQDQYCFHRHYQATCGVHGSRATHPDELNAGSVRTLSDRSFSSALLGSPDNHCQPPTAAAVQKDSPHIWCPASLAFFLPCRCVHAGSLKRKKVLWQSPVWHASCQHFQFAQPWRWKTFNRKSLRPIQLDFQLTDLLSNDRKSKMCHRVNLYPDIFVTSRLTGSMNIASWLRATAWMLGPTKFSNLPQTTQ